MNRRSFETVGKSMLGFRPAFSFRRPAAARRCSGPRAWVSIVALVSFATANASFARLNETFDQIRTRYGYVDHIDYQPRADYPLYVFQKDGMTIGVRFIDGKSAQEVYTAAGPASDFIAADILNANSQGFAWTSTPVGQSTSYQRADGAAIAHYKRGSKKSNAGAVLMVQTSQFAQLVNIASLNF